MKKVLLTLFALGLAFVFAGCAGMGGPVDDERPFSSYDAVFQTTYDTLKEYGLIVASEKHRDMLTRGPGTIVAELPISTELGYKTKTTIIARLKPLSFEYVDLHVRVVRAIDQSEVTLGTAAPDIDRWVDVAYDKGLEVKIHNEIWDKLAGKYLKEKKKLTLVDPAVKEQPLQPSASEQQLYAALDKKLTVDFDKAPMTGVVETLRKMADVNIAHSAEALEMMQKETSVVTLKLSDTSLRNVLNLVMAQGKGLVWTVKHGVVFLDVKKKKPLVIKPKKVEVVE